MESANNKKEYLKKYLSGGDKKSRKKKVVSSSSSLAKSKIIDDDFDLKKLRPLGDNELDIYDMNEDAPQVVGIVDDRPNDIQLMSQFKETKKWKVVTREYEDVQISAINNDQDSDQSPERTQIKGGMKKINRKKQQDSSDSDANVSRKNNAHDSDASPPRRTSTRPEKGNEGRRRLPFQKRKDDNDSDNSPPRKKKQADSDSDVSPPRNKRPAGPDPTSSRKKRGRDSDSDLSPRRSGRPEPRLSDRGSGGRHQREDSRRRDGGRNNSNGKSNKTLEGKKAGLQNIDEMRKEAAEIRKRQHESLAKLGDDVSGRGAETIVRDRKTGRKKDFREEARQKREKEAKEAELQEKYAVWGKGLKQVDEKAKKMKEDLLEMSKPLARYANDVDLEELQRNEEREGDPMLEYFREKKRKEGRGGPVKQLFQGNFAPNRYGIRPGSKWDGVDRSSGYEKKWFEEQNQRRALQDDSYKWSTEDM